MISALALIYQALSPQVLLKRKTYLDANTLNQDFYDELLYILGLKENTQSGKVLILPSQTQNTFLDSICSTFGLERDKDFETLFSLLTTWNNRLLFLRLLESMLLSFKHIEKPFLDLDCLKDFQALNTLFFDILAKIEENRDANLPKILAQIPYLNSSLFEKTPLEIEGKEIKLLESKPLILYTDSILYKDKNFCISLNLNAQTKDSALPLLEYLFAFLHAYDFTTTAKDIQNHTKMNFDKLINSAVLGLVFEKLNGYKEGSFYTPSFITRYMCKQSLEKVVLEKFNSAKNWNCKDLESIKTKLDKLTDSKEGYKSANAIFDSIRICDPAVGSGHFLVAALNELILLKFRLGILCDENHHRIKDITLEILRDEIVIRDSHNALFTYALPAHENIESHKIQRALFFAKRKLIESCLFGVDINPNSCEITKLRLWIELLKYSYYKDIPNKRLETLPNIDINIKCGNSLISRFNLSDSLRTIPNINFQIEQYKKLVFEYKNADQNLLKISKKDIERQIETIQATFTLTLKDPKTKKELEKAIESHIKQFNDYLLDDLSLLEGLGSLQFNLFGTPTLSEEEQEKALESYGRIQALRKKLDLALSGAEYKNAFEWRFAFPEVLDSNGDFLGFDLVIGNPPYIDSEYMVRYMKNIRDIIKQKFKTTKGNWDIYIPFFEKALEISNSFVIFVTPDKWLLKPFGLELRKMIYDNIILITRKGDVFDSARVDSIVTFINKYCKKQNIDFYLDDELVNNIDKKLIQQDFALDYFSQGNSIIEAIQKKNITLLDFAKCENACATADAYKLQPLIQDNKFHKMMFKIINTGTIGKYISKFGIKPMKYLKQSYQNPVVSKKVFIENFGNKYKTLATSKKLIVKGLTLLDCCLDLKAEIIPAKSTLVIAGEDEYILKFLCAIINSKIAFYYIKEKYSSISYCGGINFTKDMINSLPIPKITKSNQKIVDRIIALVDEILKLKAKDSTTDTSKPESQIDKLVYELYNLNESEIKIIESK